MPGDDEAVARIVPLAARDDDRPGNPQAAEHVDAAAAGVLHQHQPGEPVHVDRPAVDLADLIAGKRETLHGNGTHDMR